VPIGRQYLEIRPQVTVDGRGFRRRFYDQKFYDSALMIKVKKSLCEKFAVRFRDLLGLTAWSVPPLLLMAVVLLRVKHQVFHPGVIGFLAGLVKQHHENHPLDVLQHDFITFKRHQAVENQLSPLRIKDAGV